MLRSVAGLVAVALMVTLEVLGADGLCLMTLGAREDDVLLLAAL